MKLLIININVRETKISFINYEKSIEYDNSFRSCEDYFEWLLCRFGNSWPAQFGNIKSSWSNLKISRCMEKRFTMMGSLISKTGISTKGISTMGWWTGK